MTVHEPATLATDILLGALGCGFAWRLRRLSGGAALVWWRRALWLMAASAFAGGAYHGFARNFPPAVDLWWWRGVLWIICGLGWAMAMSLLNEVRPRAERIWERLLAAKLVVAAVAVWLVPAFAVAMADYGLPMLAWVIAAIVLRRAWSGPMLAGVGLSIVAAVVQQRQWGLSVHFNHNDVFHLIQALALMAFYRGGVALAAARLPFGQGFH